MTQTVAQTILSGTDDLVKELMDIQTSASVEEKSASQENGKIWKIKNKNKSPDKHS